VIAAIDSSHAIEKRESEKPFANAGRPPKIAPWVIEHTANGQQAEFFVVLGDQADLSGASMLRNKAEKGLYICNALRKKSETTQAPILQWLREHGIEHRSFYIVNAIMVTGSREIVEALAARPEVARLEGNPRIQNLLPQPRAIANSSSEPGKRETIEPNISYTHAPDVWALGFRGQGITVGGADTGQRWTHNALKSHYRGWDGQNADHNYNWQVPFTTVLEILAATIRRFHAMISAMARIPSELRLAMTASAIRSVWHPAQSGSVAVTWTRATARRPNTLSAWNGSWHRIR
jgi:hypothetical protein